MLKRLLALPLFRTAGLYTIGNLMNAAIPFFLIPIMTRYLSAEAYGTIAMYAVIQGIVAPLVGMSSHSTIQKRYFDQDRFDFAKYLGNCLIILMVSTGVVLVLFTVFQSFLFSYTLLSSKWLFSVVGITFCMFLTQCSLYIWQVSQKPIQYVTFLISMSALNFLLSVFFVVRLGEDWQGRITAQLLTSAVFALLSLYMLWKKGLIKIEYDKEYIKDIARLSFPLIPHSLAALLFAMTDRIVLTNLSGLERTGVYSVAYQLGSLMMILTSSFNSAYVPWLFKQLKEGSHQMKLKIVKLTYAYFILIWVLAGFIMLSLKWVIPYLVGPNFMQSADYIVWIISGFAFNGMYLMITNYIFYAEKTYYLAIATVCITLFNIGLCYTLVKLNGPIGAAQSSAISYFFYFILSSYFCTKSYPMPWNLKTKHV